MTKQKTYVWRRPGDYGSTVTARLARLWLYHGLLFARSVKQTARVKAHLGRIASEIEFLEALQDGTR